ncbi:hypothetical protein HZB74_00990 [Candidatus Saccharibacteria bacterium]|nr:hypothetical protein [Candidatus Saccharibacteria bacterium]
MSMYERSKSKYILPLAAVLAGALGGHALEGRISEPSRADKEKLEQALRPSAVQIGEWAIKQAQENPSKVVIKEDGSWGNGSTSIEIETQKNGEDGEGLSSGHISVGLHKKGSQLDPTTTFGVDVYINRLDDPDYSSSPPNPYEYVYLEETTDGSWRAQAQLNLDRPVDGVVFLDVNDRDAYLVNADAAADKAIDLVQEILDQPLSSAS